MLFILPEGYKIFFICAFIVKLTQFLKLCTCVKLNVIVVRYVWKVLKRNAD